MDLDKILEENQRVLLYFWASWCGPCKMTAPVVEEVRRYVSDVKIVKINVEEDKEIVESIGISSIPAFVYYKNGQLVNRITGAATKETLLELIEEI